MKAICLVHLLACCGFIHKVQLVVEVSELWVFLLHYQSDVVK